MGPQYPVPLLAAILLIPATCLDGRHQRFNNGVKFQLRARSRPPGLPGHNPNDPVCSIANQDDDFGPYFEEVICSNPNDLCGIDKSTGEVQGCVPSSQCPAGTGKALSCDPKMPSCCCLSTLAEYDNDEVVCNDVWQRDDTSKCKQACGLPELQNFDFCKVKLSDKVYCAFEYSDGEYYDYAWCYANQYCGIDRITGKLQGCVNNTVCPASAKGSKKVTCDPTKASCCCQEISSGTGDKPDENVECNHIKNSENSRVWEQACKLPELSSLPICKVNPTKRVNCMYKDDWDNEIKREECKAWELCGIAKKDGEMRGCLHATECPAKAFGSEKLVCDGSSPNCCCQKPGNPGDHTRPCNDLVNDKDSSIWQQACSLPELSGLDVCIDDPSKKIYCSWDGFTSTECRPSEFCGISKSSGDLQVCIDRTECPAGAKGSTKVVCDADAPFCCCQKLQAKYDNDDKLPCNNILTWKDTSVWEQACKLGELEPLEVCKTKPSEPTTPPPPTAPPTPTPPPTTPGPVKPEDMDSECLNFCKDEKPDEHPDSFRVYCADAKTENTCPSPCPSSCGKFCWDGRHMECPPLGGGPPPPPPRESEPVRGTDYVDLDSRSMESEAGIYTAFTIISLLVLLIFAGCIYLCCMSSGTVVAPLPFAAQQQIKQMQQQAYQTKAFNSSTAATSSGTPLSSSESSLSSIAIKR